MILFGGLFKINIFLFDGIKKAAVCKRLPFLWEI